MRFLLLSLAVLSSAAGAEVLNLSGRNLPRQQIGAAERKAIEGISSAADAARLLDSPCVVARPEEKIFLSDAYLRRDTSMKDTSARMQAVWAQDERDEKSARAKADRLAKALLVNSAFDSSGLVAQKQIATTLRTVLLLAVSPNSGVRPEAQAWIRSDTRLQTALGGIFEAPRARRSPEFTPAIPAVDYLLGRGSDRSEDSFRALEKFIAKFLS